MNNTKFHKTSLEVFIPNESNLEQSVAILLNLYSQRTRRNHEFWLVDISAWRSLNEALGDLKQLPLDFDDNFYLYTFLDNSGPTTSISLWEHYEIHTTLPRKTLPFGKWTGDGTGLEHSKSGKWVRRRNLEVNKFYNLHKHITQTFLIN